jgi:hypothetical protein
MNVPFPQPWSDATMGGLLNKEIHPMKEITTLGIDLAKNVFATWVKVRCEYSDRSVLFGTW